MLRNKAFVFSISKPVLQCGLCEHQTSNGYQLIFYSTILLFLLQLNFNDTGNGSNA